MASGMTNRKAKELLKFIEDAIKDFETVGALDRNDCSDDIVNGCNKLIDFTQAIR